jgi:hypothetical protein
VFQQNKQVHRVGGSWDEIEFLVKVPGGFVFGMNRQGPDAGDFGGLQRALHGIAQECLTDPLTLPAMVHGQTRQQHDGHRMACQTLGQALGGLKAVASG